MYMMDYLFSIVGLLLSVAFFTLMERKVMGLMHYRKGPNKIVLSGLMQPMSDALKLLTKETTKFSMVKIMMYLAGPNIVILTMVLCWSMYDYTFQEMSGSLKIIMTLAVMSISMFGLLFMSWGSNSKYAMLGGHRGVAQAISYEVCLFLFIVAAVYLSKSYSYTSMMMIQQGLWISLFSIPLFITWLMLCMAESNRTPFDMAEGESEIVSGFNIEYGGGLFALIFISEYGMMIFLSFITAVFFMGNTYTMVKVLFLCFMFVWIRCSFPRVRYDKLMMLSWKIALPYSLIMMSLMLILL